MDDDALYYASVAPDYDEHNLNMDGEAKTREQHREEADHTIMEELQGGQEEERMEQDPVPPYEPVQHEGEAAFATSALQMSLVEPANVGPAQLSTPNSAATSMPSSEAVSAMSLNSNTAVPQTRRSTIAARCSRNYRGPYTQPASSSSRSHLPPPRRSPSPLCHYSPPPSCHHSPVCNVSPRCYSPPTRHYSRRSPSLVCRSTRH